MQWSYYRMPYWDFRYYFGFIKNKQHKLWKKTIREISTKPGVAKFSDVEFEIDMTEYKDGKYPKDCITIKLLNTGKNIFKKTIPIRQEWEWWVDFLDEIEERSKPGWNEDEYKAKKEEQKKKKIKSSSSWLQRKYCSECDKNGQECILGVVTVCNRIICEDCYEEDEYLNGYKWESFCF
jgi:hypothetical protein